MIKGKESFIENVSRCLGRASVPVAPAPLTLPSDVHQQVLKNADTDELKQVFKESSEASGTTVFECAESDLQATLLQALKLFDQGSVVVGDHSYFREQGIVAALQHEIADCYLWDTANTREENMKKAETAMVGITMAELGLAESGTVILLSHKGSGRSVSLLPTYSITVVKACDLRPRLTQGMEFLENIGGQLPASVNFVSGASSTADIELVHVKGVHGPLRIAYVVVD
jgi:L-lactate dehydrogenase complex protein LldG